MYSLLLFVSAIINLSIGSIPLIFPGNGLREYLIAFYLPGLYCLLLGGMSFVKFVKLQKSLLILSQLPEDDLSNRINSGQSIYSIAEDYYNISKYPRGLAVEQIALRMMSHLEKVSHWIQEILAHKLRGADNNATQDASEFILDPSFSDWIIMFDDEGTVAYRDSPGLSKQNVGNLIISKEFLFFFPKVTIESTVGSDASKGVNAALGKFHGMGLLLDSLLYITKIYWFTFLYLKHPPLRLLRKRYDLLHGFSIRLQQLMNLEWVSISDRGGKKEAQKYLKISGYDDQLNKEWVYWFQSQKLNSDAWKEMWIAKIMVAAFGAGVWLRPVEGDKDKLVSYKLTVPRN